MLLAHFRSTLTYYSLYSHIGTIGIHTNSPLYLQDTNPYTVRYNDYSRILLINIITNKTSFKVLKSQFYTNKAEAFKKQENERLYI